MAVAVPIAKGRRFRLRSPQPTEHAEQVALMRWAAIAARTQPALRLLFAIPNGGARDVRTGRRLKDEGVRPGVPDLCLPVASGSYHGVFIELKRADGGAVSAAQGQWLDALTAEGYLALVCLGWQDAARVLADYLGFHA